MTHLPRRIWLLMFVPIALVGIGTIGYRVIESENYTLFDALYMTIITLSTIGYGETHELSTAGRTFTIFLVLGGVFSFAFSATEIVRTVVSGEIAEILGKRHMENALSKLNDHIIVCGFGRMGNLACKEFSRMGKPFVVIDADAELLEGFDLPHGIALAGDATNDDVLRRAGVEQAHSLVTVMASDADNLFATMSARLLNAKLVIVAKVEAAHSEQKLLRAGANRVVSPYQIGGMRVAQAVLKPTVLDFIELTTRTEHIELQLEEARIDANSALIGLTLKDSRLRADHSIIIVAIKKHGGHMLFNPSPETVLAAGDTLVAIGSRQHLSSMMELTQAKK